MPSSELQSILQLLLTRTGVVIASMARIMVLV
jgi:hypothetical protein